MSNKAFIGKIGDATHATIEQYKEVLEQAKNLFSLHKSLMQINQELNHQMAILELRASQFDSTLKATIDMRDKYQKALEKCKEQRDESVRASFKASEIFYTPDEMVNSDNKELAAILGGKDE